MHLGTELPKLETLCLSFNKMELSDDLAEMKEFRTYNDLEESVEVEDVSKVFANLKTLVMIGMDMTWKKVRAIAPFFPNLEELILDENTCNDFESIDDTILSNFKNLRVLNLNKNQINLTSIVNDPLGDTTSDSLTENHSLENLHKFPLLSELKLCYNNIQRFPQSQSFESLSYINLEFNNINTHQILTDLSYTKTLTSLRILKNPLSDTNSTRHVRNVCVGEIRSLKIVNGTELKKFDRRDFEIYYLRWAFQEFFRIKNTTQDEYDEKDFIAWSTIQHPNAVKYIDEYENPYPPLKDRV